MNRAAAISTPQEPQATQHAIVDRVRQRASTYQLPPDMTDLQVARVLHRRNSTLYLFSDAKQPSRISLVAKVPLGRSDYRFSSNCTQKDFEDRPRLFSRARPEDKPLFEYRTLRRLQQHFESLADRRFGFVRVHDYFPDVQALVMDWTQQRELRTMILKEHRLKPIAGASRNNQEDILTSFAHCGHWLRTLHQLENLPHTVTRTTERGELVAAMRRCVSYLADHLLLPAKAVSSGETVCGLAEKSLPDTLPIGMIHGDFAPRNVFVGNDCRVTVFDSLGRFRAPIYEDIAKMLLAIKASGPRMYSGQLIYTNSFVKSCESAFLSAYFDGGTIPLKRIRIFEAQQLLETWVAVVYRHIHAEGLRQFAKGFRRYAWGMSYMVQLRQIINQLNH